MLIDYGLLPRIYQSEYEYGFLDDLLVGTERFMSIFLRTKLSLKQPLPNGIQSCTEGNTTSDCGIAVICSGSGTILLLFVLVFDHK